MKPQPGAWSRAGKTTAQGLILSWWNHGLGQCEIDFHFENILTALKGLKTNANTFDLYMIYVKWLSALLDFAEFFNCYPLMNIHQPILSFIITPIHIHFEIRVLSMSPLIIQQVLLIIETLDSISISLQKYDSDYRETK